MLPVLEVEVLCFLAGGGVVGNFCCCCFAPNMAAADQGGVDGGVDFLSPQGMTGGERARPGDGGGMEEARELLELKEDATESGLGGGAGADGAAVGTACCCCCNWNIPAGTWEAPYMYVVPAVSGFGDEDDQDAEHSKEEADEGGLLTKEEFDKGAAVDVAVWCG